MKVSCFDLQSVFKISQKQVELLTKAFLHLKSIKTDEVIYHFVDKSHICFLHHQYFGDPTPTDCISFPIDALEKSSGPWHILGEIFICPQVAVEYATSKNVSPHEELSLYAIHSLLHLVGFDDLDPHEKKKMRIEEKKCMNYLKEKKVLINCLNEK